MRLFGKRGSSSHAGVPELVPVPAMADLPKPRLQSPARYLGTLTEQGEKVTGRTLSATSSSRLHLSAEALDVVRMAGSFRIPSVAMRGATSAAEFDGKPVESLLVVRWEHGEQQWRTGFRLEKAKPGRRDKAQQAPAPPVPVDQWVRTISKMSRTTPGGR
jgi:hypothetical protein